MTELGADGLIGVIGGSIDLRDAFVSEYAQTSVETPYGEPSSPLCHGLLGTRRIVYLARHGFDHRYAPHQINYRANLSALAQAGAQSLIVLNTVGGISDFCAPGSLVFPDQIIDYTYGREHSFARPGKFDHVEFEPPFDVDLRRQLAGADVTPATLGITQGPRLESAAEVRRLARDGCDIVGMTGMPEAGLARELRVPIACIAAVVNRAAGCGGTSILAAIADNAAATHGKALDCLRAALSG